MKFDFESSKHIATVGLMDGSPFIGVIEKSIISEELAAINLDHGSEEALAIRQSVVNKIKESGVSIRVMNPNDARAVIVLLNMMVTMMTAMVENMEEGDEDDEGDEGDKDRGALH